MLAHLIIIFKLYAKKVELKLFLFLYVKCAIYIFPQLICTEKLHSFPIEMASVIHQFFMLYITKIKPVQFRLQRLAVQSSLNQQFISKL